MQEVLCHLEYVLEIYEKDKRTRQPYNLAKQETSLTYILISAASEKPVEHQPHNLVIEQNIG